MPRLLSNLPLAVGVLLFGCRGATMEDYAQALARASAPGPAVARVIAATPFDEPHARMGSIYRRFREEFVRVEEAPGRDTPVPAEHLLNTRPPVGDCEDFAVLMLAFARALKLNGRIALLDDAVPGRGHARMELRLDEGDSADRELVALAGFAAAPLPVYADAGGRWAVLDLLDHPARARGFNVSPDGTLEVRP